MQSSNSLPTRSTLPPLVLSRSPSPSFPSPPESSQASIPFNKWREQNKEDKNQNKEDRNQNRKERFSQRSQRRLLSSSSSSSLPPSVSPSLSPPQSADESNYNDDYGEDENNNNNNNNNNSENELNANDLEPVPSRTRTNKNRSRLAEHTEIRQSDDSLFPPPPTSRIQQQQQIYGDVEVIEEDKREKERERERERVPPLFVSPIPREVHESVFVESVTTGKFKKTDPNTIKVQNEKRDKLLSSSLSPSLSPSSLSSSSVPLSRLFIVEKSFSFLQTIFTWLRGLLSGYGLCEVYLSVAFLREGNTELFLRVFGNTFGILHRSFLVLTVACLLSVFVKHVSLQPATPPDKAFTPAFSPSIRTSVSEQFMRNPKSTLVLCVCYIFVIISLLVDAKTTDMVEMAYKENRVVNVDLQRYFILNGIRGAAVILAWIVSIAVS